MRITTMTASPKLEEQRDAKLTLVVRRSTRQILKALKDHNDNKPKGQIIDELVEAEGLKVLGDDQVDRIKQRSSKKKG
jgi:hypothetical protein